MQAGLGTARHRGESSWRMGVLRLQGDSTGAPLDPSGMPYHWRKDGCDVSLDPN